MESLSDHQWISTACCMCTNECGVQVEVEKERIVGVRGWKEHPFSKGRMCVKGRQIPDQVYHDARLKYPMKKNANKWQRISWEEALSTITSKLKEGREIYGPESLGVLIGEPGIVQHQVCWGLMWRFCDVYGTGARFSAGDLCGTSCVMGQLSTLGIWWEPDVENADCIIVWADNPHSCAPVVAAQILAQKKKGAKLIVMDPRRIPLAKQADIHCRPRPGTDGIILLAMIHVIITEELYDKEIVEKWTIGFDQLAEHVRKYPPEEAERVSGVTAEDIREIARIFATTKPACIEFGYKITQCRSGFQNARSLSILHALTGNLDIPGGALRRYHMPTRPTALPELMGDRRHVVSDQYPVFVEYLGAGGFIEGCMLNWGDLVLQEPPVIKNMIIQAGNPAVTWPNTKKVRKALERLDFLVVMDLFMTPTAQLADIVLPACTFLERLTLGTWRGWLIRRPVIEPQRESWSDCKFWRELSKRMGYEEYFPWKSDQETLDYFLEPSGLTVQKIFERDPNGFIHHHLEAGEMQYKNGFFTQSGKIELYSKRLEKMGYDPLPHYLEPVDSPISSPEHFKDFPLILSTGTREIEYYHSEHRHLEKLRKIKPEPMAQIHPDTAAQYGIDDGDPMIVETKIGSVEIKARLTEDIMPGMVSFPHGWEDAPENMLTDDTPDDPVTGFVPLTSLLCRVTRKEGG